MHLPIQPSPPHPRHRTLEYATNHQLPTPIADLLCQLIKHAYVLDHLLPLVLREQSYPPLNLELLACVPSRLCAVLSTGNKSLLTCISASRRRSSPAALTCGWN